MFTRVRRAVVVAVAATALVLWPAVAAWADVIDPVNCVQDPANPECVIDIGTPGGSAGGGGPGCHDPAGQPVPCYIEGRGWYDGDWCWWQPATGDLRADLDRRLGQPRPPEAWFTGSCGGPGNWNPSAMYALHDMNPIVGLLAEQAVRNLALPAPRIRLNPSASAPQVTFVPTWWWIDPVVWQSRSATASAGGLSVTATGVPVSVTWSTGDGGQVVCGPGTAWVSGTDPAAASPDCGHTYDAASRDAAGGRFTVTATIAWQVTWAGAGASGTEPALTSTASVPVLVVESSALTTNR
jgi:hypothetical protein